jgi:hypothetical protein
MTFQVRDDIVKLVSDESSDLEVRQIMTVLRSGLLQRMDWDTQQGAYFGCIE